MRSFPSMPAFIFTHLTHLATCLVRLARLAAISSCVMPAAMHRMIQISRSSNSPIKETVSLLLAILEKSLIWLLISFEKLEAIFFEESYSASTSLAIPSSGPTIVDISDRDSTTSLAGLVWDASQTTGISHMSTRLVANVSEVSTTLNDPSLSLKRVPNLAGFDSDIAKEYETLSVTSSTTRFRSNSVGQNKAIETSFDETTAGTLACENKTKQHRTQIFGMYGLQLAGQSKAEFFRRVPITKSL